jgi:hypothetical protein
LVQVVLLPDFLVATYGEVSPDGVGHFPVVASNLDHMHGEEPTLTASDLGGVSSRTLVMVGDDDEVRLEHAVKDPASGFWPLVEPRSAN